MRVTAMRQEEREPITELLAQWGSGNQQALERLTPLVYAELKRLAEGMFRGESAGHTLQPTALVNEAFEALVRMDVSWQDRTHFFALSARLMRRILVNHANARRASKRGGSNLRVTLNEDVAPGIGAPDDDILALDAALTELAQSDARRAEVVELHYFGGLTYPQIATALSLSPSTVHEDLRNAKAWLLERLSTSA
jgi:RNA polymerase sigma factor (TIGR02999 family)